MSDCFVRDPSEDLAVSPAALKMENNREIPFALWQTDDGRKRKPRQPHGQVQIRLHLNFN